MKKNATFTVKKGIFSTVAMLLIVIMSSMSSCNKHHDPPPAPTPQFTLNGAYHITKDEGSDNGNNVYYNRPLGSCESTALFTFTADATGNAGSIQYTNSAGCTVSYTGHWTLNRSTNILTVTKSDGTQFTILIESLAADSFIWNAILTNTSNHRYTLSIN